MIRLLHERFLNSDYKGFETKLEAYTKKLGFYIARSVLAKDYAYFEIKDDGFLIGRLIINYDFSNSGDYNHVEVKIEDDYDSDERDYVDFDEALTYICRWLDREYDYYHT